MVQAVIKEDLLVDYHYNQVEEIGDDVMEAVIVV